MKLCPFLVAGQSMQSLEPRLGVIPVTPYIETPAEPRGDMGADGLTVDGVTASGVNVGGESAGGASVAGTEAPRLASLECLGAPCRFFHAGGCRFDAMFEAQNQALAAISAGGVRVEGGAAESTAAALATIPNVLEEVWSLQRESLREVLGGFRKLEAAQAGVATQVESTVTKVESGVATRVEALVGGVTEQMKSVETLLAAFQSSVGRVQGDLDALRNQIVAVETHVKVAAETKPAVGPEILDLVGRHFETLERDVRQIETAVRSGLGDSLRTFVKESQTAAMTGAEKSLRAVLEGVQAAVRTASAESQATLRALVEQSQSSVVQAAAEKTHTAVRIAIEESQGSLRTQLTRVATDGHTQVQQALAKLTEELQSIRDARIQIQAALDGLTRETREMASVARRVESSQVLTHELLDEQRQVHQKVDAREKNERARQLNNAGVASYHQGAYDTSVQRFKEATELDPSLGEAYNNLGLSYTEMGREEEAIVAFQRAIELDPGSGTIYNNLGYLYYRKGDLDHAVEMYQRAIQRGADTSAAYCNLGNAHYRLKRVEAAVQSWRRALEVDPANAKAAAALERLGLESRPA